jgi:broad specificity phosphatase PhoE
MRRLILVRHGPVNMDPARPAREWRLTTNGRSACQTFAQTLAPYGPARFITSQEPKAQETGAIMAAALGAPWRTAPGLHEHDRRGAPFLADKSTFEVQIADFFARPNELVFGRETAVQARARWETAVNALLDAYRDQPDPLAIVTHGTVLTLFICRHNPHLEPFPFWRRLTLPCAFILSLPTFQLQHTLLAGHAGD